MNINWSQGMNLQNISNSLVVLELEILEKMHTISMEEPSSASVQLSGSSIQITLSYPSGSIIINNDKLVSDTTDLPKTEQISIMEIVKRILNKYKGN
jgi:hypothetical protein